MKRAAFYLRVSTDGQTCTNQRTALEAIAAARGWEIVSVYTDPGISGAKGRDKRPGLDAMLNAAQSGDFDVLAAWSVDRLGRSLSDLIGILSALDSARVDLYLHAQALDTGTPSGRAMFGMLGVFAEFERALIAERVKAGLTRAKSEGKRLGRPPVDAEKAAEIRQRIQDGESLRSIAKAMQVGLATVHRIKAAA